MSSIYKCTNHKLDLICPGCVKAWIARHDRMLKFVNKCFYASGAYQPQQDAQDLLIEIGELPEKKDSECK